MLILHTGHGYYPEVGGISEVVTQISKQIASRGHQVHAASLKCTQTTSEYVANGVSVHRFDLLPGKTFELKGEAKEYVDFAKSKPWDIVTLHYFISPTTLALLPHLQNISGKKIIVSHGLRQYGIPKYKELLDQLAVYLKNVDAIVMASEYLDEFKFCIENGLARPAILPNGVDIEEWDTKPIDVRQKWGIGQRPWLLHVSNHSTVKQHGIFYDVVRKVRKSMPDAIGTIIGNSYPAAKWNVGRWGVQGGCWYKCRAASSMRNDVTLRWDVPRADVVSAIKQSNITFLTSAFECSGLVLLESSAAGTPWVSFDLGHVRDYPGGIIASDKDEMTRIAMDLLSNPSKCGSLGDEGQQGVRKHYSWKAIAEQYETLYEAVLHSTASSLHPFLAHRR